MAQLENPALKRFVAQMGDELTLAQISIRRIGTGFALCHVRDAAAAPETLQPLKPIDARTLAQSTESGEFRPLKSAPTLRGGWRILAANETDLEAALSRIYPGAVADWFAAQTEKPPVTHWHDYVNRQSGMYRITTKLSAAQVAEVIRAGCDSARCLKQRLWTVPGLGPESPATKSLLPCLEPCAVLMESARRAVRADQSEQAAMKLAAEAKSG